ncbi:MAG: tRNA-intron lyase [Nanoarchaeota archaeon]
MEKIQAHILGSSVTSNSADAFSLHKKSHFGEPLGEKIQYTITEALYLIEKEKLEILSKGKILDKGQAIKKLQKLDKRVYSKYTVFKDLRDKGYIVKTALKFGADFRVYEKGKKPGDTHAKWIVFIDTESNKFTWQEFAAKNRVAHSTKKKLLLAILDEEGDVSYYECSWTRT